MKPDAAAAHPPYRPDIDGLRAAAILSVLGFHAFPAWVPGGFIGVDIFFVISGYLISGILLAGLRDGRFSLSDFYARRVRRIFPALLLVLAAALGFGYVMLWPGEYAALAKHAAGGAGFIVNILLWREAGYFDADAATKPLLHLWSLGVEEQFYILWPLMLWAAWRWRHRAGIVIAAVIAASFAANIWLAGHDPVVDFYSPVARFWELLAGGALAWRRSGGQRVAGRWLPDLLAGAGLGLILLADFALDKDMTFPGWLALLPVGGACLLITAGAHTLVNRRLLAHPAMIWIGLISYPLYLWHWPLLSFAQIVAGESPDRTIRIGMIALSFALAALTYKFVELPIRKGGLSMRRILPLAALMIVIGGTGAAIAVTGGWPGRFADSFGAGQMLDSAALIKQWQVQARQPLCHLQDTDQDRQAPACVQSARPLLLLWGDSHAAALYPGLRALQADHGFGIVQQTQSGCPPLFDVPRLVFRANCNDINRRILADARRYRPDVVLLDAAWSHRDYPMDDDAMIDRLLQSVAQIRQALPQGKIIVIGPMPRWLSPLPAIYRRALSLSHAMPPARLGEHLDPHMARLDALMQARLAIAGVDYLSPQRQLCNADGCLTRLADGADSLTFIDQEHVTAPTATVLIRAFTAPILGALGVSDTR